MQRLIDLIPQKSSEFAVCVCNFDHPPDSQRAILLKMNTTTHILQVERDSHDGLIVTFSDGTVAGYVIEELLELRPLREPVYGVSKPVQRASIVMNGQAISANN
jgi:hypothetical protein